MGLQLGHLVFAYVTNGKHLQQQKYLLHPGVVGILLIKHIPCCNYVIDTQNKLQIDFRYHR